MTLQTTQVIDTTKVTEWIFGRDTVKWERAVWAEFDARHSLTTHFTPKRAARIHPLLAFPPRGSGHGPWKIEYVDARVTKYTVSAMYAVIADGEPGASMNGLAITYYIALFTTPVRINDYFSHGYMIHKANVRLGLERDLRAPDNYRQWLAGVGPYAF